MITMNVKSQGHKEMRNKKVLKFENYKESVFKKKIVMASQLRLKSDSHNVYTEKNK